MTIVVSVKATDGMVLAADSAATFFVPVREGTITKIYNHANKIFNLRKVWPIGAMVYGAGGIGASSVETISKDLRNCLSNKSNSEYYLDEQSYTVEEVATKARKFIYETCYLKAYQHPPNDFYMGYRVCGYSAQADLPEVWEFIISGAKCDEPQKVQSRDEFGLRWAGEEEALDRLFFGTTTRITGWLVMKGFIKPDEAQAIFGEIIAEFGASPSLPAMFPRRANRQASLRNVS